MNWRWARERALTHGTCGYWTGKARQGVGGAGTASDGRLNSGEQGCGAMGKEPGTERRDEAGMFAPFWTPWRLSGSGRSYTSFRHLTFSGPESLAKLWR